VKLVAACAVALALAAPASAAVVATAAQNGKSVRVKQGQILAIVLESSPPTGYSWRLVGRTGPVLSAPGQGLVSPKAPQGMVGVPGVAVFTFQATRPGRATVRLAYIGPGRTVGQRYSLNVVVHS
jgi:inhibitor of cysteine peptidase